MDELSRLMSLCSRREYCSYDIADKLRKRGVSPSESAAILKRLKDERYIDDHRFAEAFVRDKFLLGGWGSKKIAFYLKMKHIDDDIIKKALLQLDDEKVGEKLKDLIHNKWRSLQRETDLEKRKMKTIRFAMGRGYDYPQCCKILNEIIN